ncbi:uncharacterized protein EI97DRAFT_444528 [Westerdykella ornata]|uniref:JmjC domain-containing histone demethylation protein 1 n=1 Tax=Westerdykella ornata TaxID=318751 RepID=A0A6A6JCR8_WESOR|nr:uncharacterized protein EI97DRAFT_444528 [Westerdykella ornata]KAF2273973.1 hypothetical protein EI97DRAFT_444528 [Westerdykella ornata]
MNVSGFKVQSPNSPLPANAPQRPGYEPISPILAPSNAPAAHPASGNEHLPPPSAKEVKTAEKLSLRNDRSIPSPPHLQSPPAAPREPLHSAPLPPSKPRLSSALASPISALQNAAPPSADASPISHSSHPPRDRISLPTEPAPAYDERARKHGHAEPGTAYGDRTPKRARSNVFSHDQQRPRPATSHSPGWSDNALRTTDNGVLAEDIQAKRLSEAQLLLDFAANAPYAVKPHVPLPKRWSIPYSETSGQRIIHGMPPPSDGYLPVLYHEAQTNEHLSPRTSQLERHRCEANALAASAQESATFTVQNHTPPEDTTSARLHQSVEWVTNGDDKRPKKHQGWPKGKPRGPRNVSTVEKKKRPVANAQIHGTGPAPGSSGLDQLYSPLSLPLHVDAVSQQGIPSQIAVPEQIPSTKALSSRRLSCSDTLPAAQSPLPSTTSSRAQSVPPHAAALMGPAWTEGTVMDIDKPGDASQTTICAGCHSSDSLTSIGDGEQWISCDGCKGWFHYVCAGFKSEREVRVIDKFYCEGCKPKYGNTTRLRKSSRAHTAVDYAGLNEGILKTSDDNPEHHYIQAFKNGDFKFTPETFARLPPEFVTADFIEKMNGFTDPVVIPATLNPRPTYPPSNSSTSVAEKFSQMHDADEETYGFELVPDDGQDKIDMVIPDGLTVRRVSELYGPMETVPVIDVKAQEGEDKRWTMAKWADYYEQQGEKPVRNVISLEVSRSRLGRLIRRPKVVRDMDLQDSVWPEDDKMHAPPVQFYCLMSVADCYTDFHIDFGGSSVYYHIIKGRKTFFFIPPTKQNLKKYEDWCLSPRQSHEFLGQQVKECYRVDLYPGDTMLIPSGWIHAVWTPEDSLVIGGNYLTRIHYAMQIKVVEIEKNTKVAARFRYPFFQKIMWLAVIKYLLEDPLPAEVEELLLRGEEFKRTVPIFCQPDKFGHNSDPGPENYNIRYYPKAELEGLPDLLNYIWRTVLISLGKVEGISQQTRNAVTRSIPKGHGEPSDLARRFAMWVAWKRGNEKLPQWALPDATLSDAADSRGDKKLSSAQSRKVERESWNETLKLVRGGERHSSLRARASEPTLNGDVRGQGGPPVTGFLRPHKEHVTTPKTSQLGPKRIACDACRKRRIRCKHKDELVESPQSSASGTVPPNATASSSPPSTSIGNLAMRRYSDADIPSASLTYSSLYDVQGSTNGGPLSTDLTVDSLASKSGRVKACADCRKSKRRCIHDEYGNVDPVKAAEAPIPRGSATKKRRVSEHEDGEALTKKMKMESFAGLVNGEVSHWNRYPLQKPRLTSASDSQDEMTMDSARSTRDPRSLLGPPLAEEQTGGVVTQVVRPMSASKSVSKEPVYCSIENVQEEVVTSGPVDPLLLNPEPRTPRATNNAANGIHAAPESSPIQNGGRARGLHSWNGRTTTPKITPRGRNRRDSKDSPRGEPKSDPKARASPPKTGSSEDMASIALALKLQMEEHGLRRRSK